MYKGEGEGEVDFENKIHHTPHLSIKRDKFSFVNGNPGQIHAA